MIAEAGSIIWEIDLERKCARVLNRPEPSFDRWRSWTSFVGISVIAQGQPLRIEWSHKNATMTCKVDFLKE